MEDWKKEIEFIYRLLDQEVANYRKLVEEIKEEARCLRAGETEPLMRSVRAIEDRVKTIRMIEEEVQKKANAILHHIGKGEEDHPFSRLSSLLPSSHQSRLSSYQRTLSQLKAWVNQLNERNKAFIHDYMNVLSTLVSPLINQWNESSKYPGYKPFTGSFPYALNQEV